MSTLIGQTIVAVESTSNTIIFNTSEDDTGVGWVMSTCPGWSGSPAGTLQVTQKPRSDGGYSSESYMTPRVMAPTGFMWAPTQDALVDAKDRLNSAFSLADATMTVREGSTQRMITVRRQDVTLFGDETEVWSSWSAQVVAADPRKMGTPSIVSTALPSSTGGLTVPFTVPFTIDSTVVTGQASAINPGNVNGPVLIRIDGPVVGPVITHVGSGATLTFASSYSLAAGAWLEIDMENKSVLENGQASRNGFITSRGWSQFEPGNNTWAFTAQVFSAGARMTVTATPAWE